MEDLVPFASRAYFLALGLLVFARGMDFLSTRVATPNLVLEGNPVARRLGWRWGLVLNLLFCLGFALWPLPAIVISTTSLLVAARNFQSAWLMRSMGEDAYRDWHIDRLMETKGSLLFGCLAGQSLLTAAVGAALVGFSPIEAIPWAIGVGIIAYSAAVAFYTGLALWRIRRSAIRVEPARLLASRREDSFAPPRGAAEGTLLPLHPVETQPEDEGLVAAGVAGVTATESTSIPGQ